MATDDSIRVATPSTLPTEIRQFMDLAGRVKALGYTLAHDTIHFAGDDDICLYVRTPAGKLAAIAPATAGGMAELRAWCTARETIDRGSAASVAPVERDRDRASMLAADAAAQLEGAVDVLAALCRDDELGRGHATFALLQRDLRAVRALLERIESGDCYASGAA